MDGEGRRGGGLHFIIGAVNSRTRMGRLPPRTVYVPVRGCGNRKYTGSVHALRGLLSVAPTFRTFFFVVPPFMFLLRGLIFNLPLFVSAEAALRQPSRCSAMAAFIFRKANIIFTLFMNYNSLYI